ncbi:hypothetical protein B0H17DRAFT_1149208 [Mycena rosella]|uniref:Uncharacterized protein n=1 Tax=Mycena rosella TaxID=1033263 RepID=A0AAD7C386_MYCRO|nr:hypothetical protein B0H17DRAFT_1149208 [Mycena rosella]
MSEPKLPPELECMQHHLWNLRTLSPTGSGDPEAYGQESHGGTSRGESILYYNVVKADFVLDGFPRFTSKIFNAVQNTPRPSYIVLASTSGKHHLSTGYYSEKKKVSESEPTEMSFSAQRGSNRLEEVAATEPGAAECSASLRKFSLGIGELDMFEVIAGNIVAPNLYVAPPGGVGSTRCYIATGYLCRGPGLYVLKRCFQMQGLDWRRIANASQKYHSVISPFASTSHSPSPIPCSASSRTSKCLLPPLNMTGVGSLSFPLSPTSHSPRFSSAKLRDHHSVNAGCSSVWSSISTGVNNVQDEELISIATTFPKDVRVVNVVTDAEIEFYTGWQLDTHTREDFLDRRRRARRGEDPQISLPMPLDLKTHRKIQ